MPANESLIPDDARCIDCGYALHALTNNLCPECGRAFDSEDSSTFECDGKRPRWRKWARAPSLWSIVPLVCLAAYEINYASVPDEPISQYVVFGLALLGLPVLIVEWVYRIAACRCDSQRAAADHGGRRRRRAWRWGVLPLCLLTVCSSPGHDGWPTLVRFWMSRSAFEDAKQQVESDPNTTDRHCRVGLYRVWIHKDGGNTLFVTGVNSEIGYCGFVKGPIVSPGLEHFWQFADNWYQFIGYVPGQ